MTILKAATYAFIAEVGRYVDEIYRVSKGSVKVIYPGVHVASNESSGLVSTNRKGPRARRR